MISRAPGAPGGVEDQAARRLVGQCDRGGGRVEDAGRRAHDALDDRSEALGGVDARGQRRALARAQRPAQRLGERGRARDAPLGHELHARAQGGVERRRDVGVASDQRRAVGVGRRRARDQRHQRDREAEDVRALGDPAAAEDLRRHEARRADGDRPVARLAQLARDAEVDEHDAAVGHDEVLRLHVAVDDVLLVDVVQGLARLAAPLDDVLHRQPRRALGREPIVQALALDQLHDDVVVAGVAEVVDDAHDARVVELGQQPRLDLEARDVRRVQQALDRDEAAGLAVEGAMDRAHRAAGDGGLDRVMAAHHGSRIAGRHRAEHSYRVARTMEWFEVFAVFLVSHLVGDYLLQTDWQAVHKHRGLGPDPVARRALVSHVATYTLAFVPALIWLGGDLSIGGLIAVAAGIAIPHLVQDDGRLLALYVSRVKGCDIAAFPLVGAAVDQTMHIVALFALALLVAS